MEQPNDVADSIPFVISHIWMNLNIFATCVTIHAPLPVVFDNFEYHIGIIQIQITYNDKCKYTWC